MVHMKNIWFLGILNFVWHYSQTGNQHLTKVLLAHKMHTHWWTTEFDWCYLQIYGWGFTWRSINDSKTAVSQKPIPTCVTAHRSWKAGKDCSTCSQSNGMKDVPSRWLSWSELPDIICLLLLLPGGSADLHFFQAAHLVFAFSRMLAGLLILPGSLIWASPRQLSWTENYSGQALQMCSWGRGVLVNLVSFRESLKMLTSFSIYSLSLEASLNGDVFHLPLEHSISSPS